MKSITYIEPCIACGQMPAEQQQPTDTQMLDFLESDNVSIGAFCIVSHPKGKPAVKVSTAGKTLREAIAKAMEQTNE